MPFISACMALLWVIFGTHHSYNQSSIFGHARLKSISRHNRLSERTQPYLEWKTTLVESNIRKHKKYIDHALSINILHKIFIFNLYTKCHARFYSTIFSLTLVFLYRFGRNFHLFIYSGSYTIGESFISLQHTAREKIQIYWKSVTRDFLRKSVTRDWKRCWNPTYYQNVLDHILNERPHSENKSIKE